MLIAILGDTHDDDRSISAALAICRECQVEQVLHTGDVTTPETVALFRGLPMHFVWGNCDGDTSYGRRFRGGWERDFTRLREAAAAIGAQVHEPFGSLELAGRKIAWVHGDDGELLHELEQKDEYDYLFYGHTHVAEQHRTGRTLVVNPGALYRAKPRQFVLLDLDTGELRSVIVPS